MVKPNLQQGVTLVELLVVIFIFVVVSSVLMFNFSDFSTNVSLRNLSQDIALSIRKAQSYATSVRSINGGVQSDQFPAYGLAFSLDSGGATYEPNSRAFVFFADVGSPANNKYDNGGNCGSPAAGDECVENFTITSADKIVRICPDGNCVTSGDVNIVFRRPIPNAEFCVLSGGSCLINKPAYVDIVIQSPKGLEKTITVWNTGQISTK